MCRFPLEASYSKTLLASLAMKCEDDMITLVSMLSTENIWMTPVKKDEDTIQIFREK